MSRAVLAVGILLLSLPLSAAAAPASITYRYRHHIVTIPSRSLAGWREPAEEWTLHGRPFTPPSRLRVDGDELSPLPAGIERLQREAWNTEAMKATLAERVVPLINRTPGMVTIRANGSGGYAFDGVGYPGRAVDLEQLASLTARALEENVGDVTIPVDETPPSVTVDDPYLREVGVRELVAFGESAFDGSPVNRRHNIGVGLARFNGHLIPQGSVFSFVKILGPVDGTAGYRKELVIKGDRTEPDYGGGLCQVSTTAYRGVWEAGFPITERRNHSYAVRYYWPQGTDATTYVPSPDLKFKNDSPGALLIQTYAGDDHAYFLYYGTRVDRTAEVIGPYTWGQTKAPPARTEYTTALPPGTRKVLGHAVPGVKAAWFRITKTGTGEKIESFYSTYEARPDFYQVGVENLPTGSGTTIPTE